MSISRCIRLLEEFAALAEKNPGPTEYSASYGEGRHLLISALVHGDEVGTLPALLAWMRKFDQGYRPPFKVSFLLGNVEAAIQGRRYLEQDLNRSFGSIQKPQSLEEKRAREIAPVILSADLFIDLHQTITPSRECFHVFAFHEPSYRWARVIGSPSKFVTHPPEDSFSNGDLTSDEYAQRAGIPSLSVEFLQKGFSAEAEEASNNFLDSSMQSFEKFAGREKELTNESRRQKDLDIWFIRHRFELQGRQASLRPGLENLMPVERGDSLGQFSDGAELKAEHSGLLLFPKYPSAENPGPTMAGALYIIAEPAKPSD